MTDKRVFFLAHTEARRRAQEAIKTAPDGYKVTIAPPPRSLEQNAALWARLGEISERVVWQGQKLTPEDWKDLFTALLRGQKVVPGLEGGFVVLGSSTSRMQRDEFGDLLTTIDAWCALRPEMQEVAA